MMKLGRSGREVGVLRGVVLGGLAGLLLACSGDVGGGAGEGGSGGQTGSGGEVGGGDMPGSGGGSGGGAACVVSCGAGECQQGVCVCGAPFEECSGACVDTAADREHCGGCGLACAAGELCVGGGCVSECPEGLTECSEACVDVQTSSAHCGGCDQPCDGICAGGTCADDEEDDEDDEEPLPETCPSIANPDVRVTGSGGSWTIEGLGGGAENRPSIKAALERAFARLSSGRTSKQSVVVEGSGSVGSNERIELPSYTTLELCGTIDVTNAGGSGDQAPLYARNRQHIEIRRATITGAPLYTMFFREVSDLHLGKIDIRVNSGFGIRIDNNPQSNDWGRSNRVRNIRIDDVYVSGTSNHGVETYGVDGLTVGQVVARNVGYAGLLLNATINAEVGLVDGEDVATGQGYAVFRVANEAGRDGAAWPAGNIHVGKVRARRGGRGIFCVSDSGGLTVDEVDIADTGNNAILLENCHQTRIGAVGGTVSGGGEVRIAHRTNEHTPSSNVTLQNLTVTGTTIRESPCGTGIRICNISGNPTIDACAGTVQASCP